MALHGTQLAFSVTHVRVSDWSNHYVYDQVLLPEEVATGSSYDEGDVQQALVNRYERDRAARRRRLSFTPGDLGSPLEEHTHSCSQPETIIFREISKEFVRRFGEALRN